MNFKFDRGLIRSQNAFFTVFENVLYKNVLYEIDKGFCDSSDNDQFLTSLINCFCNQCIMVSDQFYKIHDQLHVTSGQLEKRVCSFVNHKPQNCSHNQLVSLVRDWSQKNQVP
jgi:hypothetical protein